MDKALKPLPARPLRQDGENDCGFALRLLSWYDQAIAKGHELAELPTLSCEERRAILASWQPVLCIAYNLGLIPLPTNLSKKAPPAVGSPGPAGMDEPSCTPAKPAAPLLDEVVDRLKGRRRGQKSRRKR